MKLRLLLCAIGLSALGGCVTTSYYADDGYYGEPGDGYTGYDDGYYSDGYYDDDDRYDDGYYGSPYGGGPHFSFNLQFGGYGGFIPYGNCWYGDAYCYGRHPRYGWGYWPNPYYSYYGPSYGWPSYGAWPGFGWPYYGGYHPPRPPKPKRPKPPKPVPVPPVVEPGDSDAPVIVRPVTRPPRPGFPEAERPGRPRPPKPTPPIPTGESNDGPTDDTPLPSRRPERPERPRVREDRPEQPVWNVPPRSERPKADTTAPQIRLPRIERPTRVESPRADDDARGRAGLIERQQAPRPQAMPMPQPVVRQPMPAREARQTAQQVRPAAAPRAERPTKTQRTTPTVDDEP